ncbi:MAG TPA: tRNA lysidine(34) synthetase TilS [Vicinamibacterales bacterium]|nr:tRNA lysidine(34) synthetase TilS [Vicinamibacterales bacterium]
MGDVVAAIARTIRLRGLVRPDDRVAIALSGGADSVALAWILRVVVPDLGATIAGLVHVNHGLRGPASDADEAFCRALAERLAIPIEVHSRDVAAIARSRRVSLEVAAREARYECFETSALRLDATVVATGHTEDDQAETVLLRVLRGAGTRGLSGIRIRRGMFVRPLLETRRADLRRYLAGMGEPWCEDASNADVSIARNRVRHELLPVLSDIAPEGVTALARLARLAQDDEEFLEKHANARAAGVVLQAGVIDAAALAAFPPAPARRLVRQVAAETAPNSQLSARHIEAVCHLAATDNSLGSLDLPGLTVVRRGARLEFVAGPRSRPERAGSWPERRLDVPGTVDLPEVGAAIDARRVNAQEARDVSQQRDVHLVVVAGGLDVSGLLVRNRRPGDRLHPLGAPGRRKLQDVFVDRKVPRLERDTVPIVTDARGEILWVAGVALSERCRIRTPGDDMLILELRKH